MATPLGASGGDSTAGVPSAGFGDLAAGSVISGSGALKPRELQRPPGYWCAKLVNYGFPIIAPISGPEVRNDCAMWQFCHGRNPGLCRGDGGHALDTANVSLGPLEAMTSYSRHG